MSELGSFALLLGLFLSCYAVVVDLLGSWRKDSGLIKSARNTTGACFVCLSVAIVALWVLLIKNDFAVIYVAENSSRALPLTYKISALWAGSAGSLLLWLWIQVGFVVLVYCRTGSGLMNLCSYARVSANLVSVFFFIILVNDRNPFELSTVAPADGLGLNPLLQHPAMVLHPPILFVGYAGFVIPFAWAFGRLRTNDLDGPAPLLRQARNWTLLAWLFLTGGIVLGAWWAYEELGWGGYWAWDPVENSSLMPWITATALLHCYRTYRPRSTIATWTTVLGLVTFSLCIFGRFLTKYGLVSSVHKFQHPGLGILYVVLLLHMWVIVGVLALRKRLRLKTDARSERVSGPKSVTVTNWLMVLLAFVIFIGTLFPFLSKVFIKVATIFSSRGGPVAAPISLEPEFFTRITAPGGLALLLLIGLCPHLLRHGFRMSWRLLMGAVAAVTASAVWLMTCSLDAPRAGTALGGIGWWGRWLLSGSPSVPVFILCGFAFLGLLADFAGHQLKSARKSRASRTSNRNLRWYGARIAHLGFVAVFVGIAGSAGYGIEETAVLRPGQKTRIAQYELTFEDLHAEDGPNFTAVTAVLSVRHAGQPVGKLKPAKAFYRVSGKTVSEVDVRRTLREDLYLALTAVDAGQNLINLRMMVKPLINWIWIGTCITLLGTVVVLVSLFRERTAASPPSSAKDVL